MKRQFRKSKTQHQEQGMAMVITMMMGLLLLAGASGLVARMVMGRKIGAAESYQQMAETAALNGFNRVLATLNNNDDQNYRGYYFQLDNHQGDPDVADDERWHWANARNQNLEELCTDTSVGMPGDWPRESIQISSGTTERNDGKGPIQLFYRLRAYASPNAEATGEGTFEIEGMVKRTSEDADEDEYLARTLLTRSLYIKSIVAAEDDWGVMAGHHLELGDSEVLNQDGSPDGSGLILLSLGDPTEYKLPGKCSPSSLQLAVGSTNFDIGYKIWPTWKRGLPMTSLFDQGGNRDQEGGKTRIWSFDDTGAIATDETELSTQTFMENCEDSIVCTREASSATLEAPQNIDVNLDTTGARAIKLRSQDICKGQDNDLECHIYIEHLKLSNTKLLIDTQTRPVVIHLGVPEADNAEVNMSGNLELGPNSLLCGTNGTSETCNGKPERLIIMSNTGQTGMACNSNENVLSFAGNSLPHAFIHLPRGTVRTTAESTIHGIIWAHSICAKDNKITLITENNDGTVVRATNQLWNWEKKGFPGYGRMVTRGIRGTGIDTFRRW